jgi:hypothetical protein
MAHDKITIGFEYVQIMNRKTTCDSCKEKIWYGEYAWIMKINPYVTLCKSCMKLLQLDYQNGSVT